MEDAYEIGIRLVLENGVSAGIAALQHDLASYDRALAATTGRLRTVTEVGRRLAAPAVPGGAKPVVQAATGPQTQAADAAAGPARSVPVPAFATPVPATRSLRVTAVPVPAKPPQPAAVAAPAMPHVALARRASAPLERGGQVPFAPDQPAAAAAAVQPIAPPPMPGQSPAARVAVSPPLYARYAPVSPAVGPVAAVAPDGPDGRPVAMPAPDQGETRQPLPAAWDMVRSSAWEAPSSGTGPASPGVQAVRQLATSPAAAATPAAPVAAGASSGPTQGDVYLDGARVGRWMSNQLAREAGRPQTGVTGFDPRLGPAWPGSLHGT